MLIDEPFFHKRLVCFIRHKTSLLPQYQQVWHGHILSCMAKSVAWKTLQPVFLPYLTQCYNCVKRHKKAWIMESLKSIKHTEREVWRKCLECLTDPVLLLCGTIKIQSMCGTPVWHWRDPRYARLKSKLHQGHTGSGGEEMNNSTSTNVNTNGLTPLNIVYLVVVCLGKSATSKYT